MCLNCHMNPVLASGVAAIFVFVMAYGVLAIYALGLRNIQQVPHPACYRAISAVEAALPGHRIQRHAVDRVLPCVPVPVRGSGYSQWAGHNLGSAVSGCRNFAGFRAAVLWHASRVTPPGHVSPGFTVHITRSGIPKHWMDCISIRLRPWQR